MQGLCTSCTAVKVWSFLSGLHLAGQPRGPSCEAIALAISEQVSLNSSCIVLEVRFPRTVPDKTQGFLSANYSYKGLNCFSAVIFLYFRRYFFFISNSITISWKRLIPVNVAVRCWTSSWLCTHVRYRDTWRAR